MHISGCGHQFASTPTLQGFSVALQGVGHHDGQVVPLCPGVPPMGMQLSRTLQLFASTLPVHIVSVGAQIVGQNDGHSVPSVPGVLAIGSQVSGNGQPFSSVPPGHCISLAPHITGSTVVVCTQSKQTTGFLKV